jgi:Tyrosine phosphatase family
MIQVSIRGHRTKTRRWSGAVVTLGVAAMLPLGALKGQTKAGLSLAFDQGVSQTIAQNSKLRGPEPKGPVPKYGIIWQGKLSRSGKPKNDEGWKWLREQGVNSIVNFRARDDVDYKKFGFGDYLWIPMDNGRLPTDAEAEKYLAWIQSPANQPVSIQCAEGKDRTGMMAALARYSIEGWPIDDAVKEASLYRKGEPISDERINWLRQWASKHSPGSHRRQ